MPWRHLLRALSIPAAGFALNLGMFLFVRASGRFGLPTGVYVGIVTGLAAAACALGLVALPAGVAAMLRATRLSEEGRVPVFGALRFAYRVARAVHAVEAVSVLVAFVAPFALFFEPTRLPLVIALATVIGAGILMGLLSAGRGEELEAVLLHGRVIALENIPALRLLAEPAAQKLGARLPRHVVAGLAPGVYCLQRDVSVSGDLLEGGTLYLSLPMCRLLDRGELAGLIAFEIAREHAYRESRLQSVEDARARTARLLSRRPTESPAQEALGGAYLPLALWSAALAGLDIAIWRSALQGGAVAAGRETMASAISVHLLYPPVWESFFNELQLDLRRRPSDDSRVENLSEQLARHCRAAVDGTGLLQPFDSADALKGAHPLLGLLVDSLGVAPADVAARLRSVPADPAIDVLAGAEAIERELSVAAVRELLPGWPRPRPSSVDAPADAPARRSRPAWLRPDAPVGAPVPHPDQRPMFSAIGSRSGAEGLILGGVVTLMVLVSVLNLNMMLTHVGPVDLSNLRTGPREFPISVYIDTDNISFTNRSAEPWDCAVEVGADVAKAYTATFVVEPLETHLVLYGAFRGPWPGAPDVEVQRAAHRKGTVTCVERSGRTRVWGW